MKSATFSSSITTTSNATTALMNPLPLLTLASQLSISQQSNEVVLNWSGDWLLQRTTGVSLPWTTITNGVQHYSESPSGTALFRLSTANVFDVVAEPTLALVVQNGSTNVYTIARGSNSVPTKFTLSVVVSNIFPTNPTFDIRGGQARFTAFYDQEFPHPFETIGNFDPKGKYMCLVEVQDPITTPLLIRVRGQDAFGINYIGYARFVNP